MIASILTRILPLLNRAVPPYLAIKGLGKIDPRLEKFATGAALGGYGADAILDFLRNKFDTAANKSERERLEIGASQGTLRPDEMASRETMARTRGIGDTIQSALSLAAGGAGGVLASKGIGAMGEDQSGEDISEESIDPEQFRRGNIYRAMKRAPKQIDYDVASPVSQTPKTVNQPPTAEQMREMNQRAAFNKFQEITKKKRKEEDEEMKPSLANLQKQFYSKYPDSAEERKKQEFLRGLDELAKRVGL